MLSTVFSFFLNIFGSPIVREIRAAYESKLRAANDKERIAADERIVILEARRDSILAAQSDPFERFVRIGFAAPFVIYLWKLIIWDKVFALGITDNISPDLWNIAYIILGGYFINTLARGIMK